MTRKIPFIFFAVFCQINLLYSQATSTELGAKIFTAFRDDSLNTTKSLRLRQDELSTFFTFNNLDTNSAVFTNYYSNYPAISDKFYNQCHKIENDTLDNGIRWKSAALLSISVKSRDGNDLEDKEATQNAFMQIKFLSGTDEFLLIVETFLDADKLWKIGNYIRLVATKTANDN